MISLRPPNPMAQDGRSTARLRGADGTLPAMLHVHYPAAPAAWGFLGAWRCGTFSPFLRPSVAPRWRQERCLFGKRVWVSRASCGRRAPGSVSYDLAVRAVTFPSPLIRLVPAASIFRWVHALPLSLPLSDRAKFPCSTFLFATVLLPVLSVPHLSLRNPHNPTTDLPSILLLRRLPVSQKYVRTPDSLLSELLRK